MKHVTVLGITLILAFAALTTLEGQARRGQVLGAPGSVDLVEVVGCLTSGANNTWQLTNASDPVVTRSASTTPEAIKAAETKSLGKQSFMLLGMSHFEPTSHQGHKMVVRGLLIKENKETRINVTSFQMASAACAK